MKLRTKGTPININEPLVLKATRYKYKLNNPNYCLILDDDYPVNSKYDSDVILTTSHDLNTNIYSGTGVYKIKDLSHISEDDILLIGQNGNIKTLYRINSSHNYLLLTERCNSNCLMCSQPPKDREDIAALHEIHKKLIPLIPKNCHELILTGGEPMLLGLLFFELLELIKKELPNTEIHILTNGRLFAFNHLAERLSKINNPRIMLGVPLYSDFYQIHDYVVQSKDAYYQTLMGIYNLKRYGIRVEIRVVLHKITTPRLYKLSKFIYRNLTFVDQVVFMGLEITGFTIANLSELWIDPINYMDELEKSVHFLNDRGVNAWIYNTPLCLLPENLWCYNKNSISDWKNIFLDECQHCAVLDKCGGLFESSTRKHSEYIKAFKVNPIEENTLAE
ncbi:His-Xaa-Ser system radical SAM maturase HxsC [Robiginitalea marina]|uniref:His-Xaa-Ser system radical SAM maturase HxsC n=1 Tax=Robiginitalea marina TaxID=2954105 RepID=A0ABT1B0P3_9FLAO|nr:His-Xaa-Ser system radical SAM maturase HxsC [Robiginitalea marina]MCO5725534.1 His-Xaa-Ser system radical SAM maturase HxsC [Robiginitalea marina]